MIYKNAKVYGVPKEEVYDEYENELKIADGGTHEMFEDDRSSKEIVDSVDIDKCTVFNNISDALKALNSKDIDSQEHYFYVVDPDRKSDEQSKSSDVILVGIPRKNKGKHSVEKILNHPDRIEYKSVYKFFGDIQAETINSDNFLFFMIK